MSVIVYTTILGGSDSLKPAPQGVAAVCFVERPSDYPDPRGWTLVECPVTGDPRRQAWQMRCHPNELFDDYDHVIWIDASFTLTRVDRLLADTGKAEIAALRHHQRASCYEEARQIVKIGQGDADAVKRQMEVYQVGGFRPDALSISCILVRTHSAAVQRFNETWAAEIDYNSGDNTQLSLDFSAWRHGLAIKALRGTRHANPYAVHDHADHKRRRQPYRQAVSA